MIEITKIVYKDGTEFDKAITSCDVVLGNSIKLTGIRLYYKNGQYYIVFPSKQDSINELCSLNPNVDLVLPQIRSEGKKKDWDEYYYPVDRGFYGVLRDTIVKGYDIIKSRCNKTYIPD